MSSENIASASIITLGWSALIPASSNDIRSCNYSLNDFRTSYIKFKIVILALEPEVYKLFYGLTSGT